MSSENLPIESESTNTSVVDSSKLDAQIVDTANKILNGDSPESTKDLVSLFNWEMSRKNVARILKLNGLLDNVTDQMALRLEHRADQFSNDDLLDYMKTLQGAVDSSYKQLNQVEEPPMIVQQTNTQINVNLNDVFDRDSKQRILDAVNAMLEASKKPNNTIIEVPTEDTNEEQEEKK
jgi:hypothetical protein